MPAPAAPPATVSVPALARDAARLAASADGSPLRLDPSLDQAARRHAEEIIQDPRDARRERIEARLIEEGVADAQYVPFAGVGKDPDELARLFRAFAEHNVRPRAMTHLGVALVESKGRYALAAIFVRRLVELSPLPREVRAKKIAVRGRVADKDRVEALLLAPCRKPAKTCDGEVVELRTKIDRGVLGLEVPFDRGPGRYTLELVATRDRGPEISAMWTFISGKPKREILAAPERATDLATLVAAAREMRELAPLARDLHLQRAAKEHAEAVCRAMIAAHVLADGSDPAVRARRAGYEGRVAENVAIAASVERAHENLLASPSHRRTLLDPTAQKLGLGVATSSSTVCVVELFGGDDQE